MRPQESRRNFRPLIYSLAFDSQLPQCLPLQYNCSLQEISEIKKYLHKSYAFLGVDAQQQKLSETEKQALQKYKLKLRGVNGVPCGKNSFKMISKNEAVLLEWQSKLIHLRIPFNNKESEAKVDLMIFDSISHYLDSHLHIKNNQTQELILDEKAALTVEQISLETDIVFELCQIPAEANDNTFKDIIVRMPIVICLNPNQHYTPEKIKSLIKADVFHSLQIMFKHKFDTRVCITGKSKGSELLCLSSYCKGEEAEKQERKKLGTLLGEDSLATVVPEQSEAERKKENRFLLLVLLALVLLYIGLKINPIHQPEADVGQSQQFQPFREGDGHGIETPQQDVF